MTLYNYCPSVSVIFELGNIARGRSSRAILPVEGEQIIMLPSNKGKIVLLYRKTTTTIQYKTTTTKH